MKRFLTTFAVLLSLTGCAAMFPCQAGPEYADQCRAAQVRYAQDQEHKRQAEIACLQGGGSWNSFSGCTHEQQATTSNTSCTRWGNTVDCTTRTQ